MPVEVNSPFFFLFVSTYFKLLPDAFFWGLFTGASILLLFGWIIFIRKKAPVELCIAAFLFSLLPAVTGFILSHTWQLNGTFLESSDLNLDQGELVGSLFLSQVYTQAIGLPNDVTVILEKGLTISASDNLVTIKFKHTDFKMDRSKRIQNYIEFFFKETSRDKQGVIFTAKLLSASTSQQIKQLKKDGPNPLLFRKPARLVLRGFIPELKENFPGAEEVLTDISRKIGK